MKSWKHNLFLVWTAQMLSLAAFGMVVPFIPLYLRDRMGMIDVHTRGAWVAAFFFAGQIAFCVTTPIWGSLSDRYGRKIMLLRASLVSALLFPLMIFAPSALALVLLRFLIGCFSGVSNAAQTLICGTTPPGKHGFALGTLSSAMWSGQMTGFAVGGFIIEYGGFTAAFLTCGGMLLTAAALVYFFVYENFQPPPKVAAAPRPKRRFRLPDFGAHLWGILFLFLFLGLVRHFDNPFIALLVETIHGPEGTAHWTAVICSLAALAGVASGLILGHLSDRLPPRKLLIPVIVGTGLMKLLQGAALTLTVLGTGRFFNYFFAGGIDPVLQNLLARSTPDHKRGMAFGWSASFRTVGALLSSAVGGLVVYNFGVRAAFYVAGGSFLLLLPLFLHIMKRIPDHPRR